MTTDIFSDDELDRLSAEIDTQLRALQATPETAVMAPAKGTGNLPPEPQKHAIEQATGEPAPTFLARFKAAARDDICRPGGVVFEQWRKWRDVTNKDALKTVGPIAAGMGIATSVVGTVSVAIVVWLLHVGVTAFCAEGGTDGGA